MSPSVCMDVSIHVWMSPYMYVWIAYASIHVWMDPYMVWIVWMLVTWVYECMDVWMYVLGKA